MPTAYWITLANGQGVCAEAESADLAELIAKAKTGYVATNVQPLPYPANPRLTESSVPTFCMHGKKCAGRGACPRDYACND